MTREGEGKVEKGGRSMDKKSGEEREEERKKGGALVTCEGLGQLKREFPPPKPSKEGLPNVALQPAGLM